MSNIIIASILDTDLYKLTMQNVICKLFPNEVVRYEFINRGKTEFPENFGEELKRYLQEFRSFKLTPDMKHFLKKKCYYLDPAYLDFLAGYRFDPSEVHIDQIHGDLNVKIVGPWYRTVLWETPLMAAISQLYYKMKKIESAPLHAITNINMNKIEGMKKLGIKVAEFGARRRFSFDVQNKTILDFSSYGKNIFLGTSNTHFAMMYDLTPIGTMAHEFIMFHAAKYGFSGANALAMKHWVEVYNGNLGIVLPDTFTTKAFLKSFDTRYAKLFDGGRQDSGDPIAFTDMWCDHYKSLRIDPTTKSIIYSDGISSLERLKKIHNYASGKVRDAYGIGTWLTNDCGTAPLNIVIKMIGVRNDDEWIPTIKLSDSPSKYTGDEKMVDLCNRILRRNML